MLDKAKQVLPLAIFSIAILMVIIVAYPPSSPITNNNPSDPQNIFLNDNNSTNTIKDIPTNSYKKGTLTISDFSSSSKPSKEPKSLFENVINEFDEYLKKTFPGTAIPGAAVAVVYKDQVIYLNCFGVKNVGHSDPINADTIFQIGSCSKAMTSAAVAAMVDEGKMSWDDLARLYYPDPNKFSLYNSKTSDKITVRELLSHQSGLPEQAGTLHVLDFYYDFDETLYRLRFLPPEAELGAKYAYQNVIFSLAGQCASRASGMDWGQLMQKKIFDPLKMYSTVPYFNEYVKSKNHAGTHVVDQGIAYPVSPKNLDAMGPAGSISSSINDMAKWTIFQVNNGFFCGNQVISSEALGETHKAEIKMPDPDCWYGMGWVISKIKNKNFYLHAGSTQFSSSYVMISPSDQIGVAVIANDALVGLNFDSSTAWKFFDLYYKNKDKITTISPINFEHNPINPRLNTNNPLESPSLPIKNYAGTYYSNYYGKIKIVANDKNSLLLYPGKNPNPVYLSHLKENIFKDLIYDKEVIFCDISNKKPQKVITKRWEVNGANGTFERINK